MENINIKGARTHNLKNISVTIPRNKLCVITGLSGSGKSSLAFDTLYAEGQRRYVESLSAYARQFLQLMDKPDVDSIDGLSPAISIEQKSTSHNPRSTVGTITEIHDYLRLLYARIGNAKCPTHGTILKAQTISQMVDQVLSLEKDKRYMITAPVVRGRKGEYKQLFINLAKEGFIRARVDGQVCDLSDPPELELHIKHNIEVVVDRFKIKDDIQQRLAESFETALKVANGIAIVTPMDEHEEKDEIIFSSHFACPICGYSIPELEPRNFSFNNPHGACPTCDGLGVQMVFDVNKIVPDKNISVYDGAIKGWDRRSFFYYRQLEAVAKHYNIDLKKPFNQLTNKEQSILLYGNDGEPIAMTFKTSFKVEQRVQSFEGVIPNYQRRLHETESDLVRDELYKYMSSKPCPTCHGSRLKKEYTHVFVGNKSLPEINELSIKECYQFFDTLELSKQDHSIADRILKEIKLRLSFLLNVGLGYLTLSRSAETLSGGEAQRIRLASQIGAGLVGVMYTLDEPSIGLHQRDNQRLLNALLSLRDLGNTVIVVEHDEDAIRQADYILDIGPGAGVHGGTVVAKGTVDEIMKNKNSLTGDYLSGRKKIEIPKTRVKPKKAKANWLELIGCTGNNLKNVSVAIPAGCFVVVTGVSGSGKSTLINDTLVRAAERTLNKAFANEDPAPYKEIKGFDNFDKIICIDQSPIGRTPRSNPATYVGLFQNIRDLFAQTHEARARGYTAGRFSFNVKGGRCEACQGDGTIKVEMHFLPDIYVQCEECHGQRYNRETLEIKYKGKNISDVLNMTIEEAYKFFEAVPQIAKKLKTLIDVGLSYITLGQAATTFSGGEAQRIKLSKELSKRSTGKTLYVLDEPTTGLHFHDVKQLLDVLIRLRDEGNTIVVIEHNLDVIKCADYIIDLGPEGGSEGGQIIATGTPEEIAKVESSFTGQFLKPILKRGY